MPKTSGAVILFWQGREDVEEEELEDAFTFFVLTFSLSYQTSPFTRQKRKEAFLRTINVFAV